LIVIRRRTVRAGKIGSLGWTIGDVPVCCAIARGGMATAGKAAIPTIAISDFKLIARSKADFHCPAS
jgi:hypothetical protein